MNRAKINYIVDFLAFMSFLIVSFSGVALKIFMPSGVRQGRFQEFLGFGKETWLGLHDLSGVLLIVLVVAHLILHWDWIVRMTKRMLKSDAIE